MTAKKTSTSSALAAMAGVVITTFVVAALYVGRDVLIPIALAALLAFLLSPAVTYMERWIGRVAAALVAVVLLFSVLGGVGWVLTRQVLDLAEKLPDYKVNIQTKLKGLKMPGDGRFSKFNETVEELKKDLPGAVDEKETRTAVAVPQGPMAGGLMQGPASSRTPMPVEIVETKHAGPMEQVGMVIAPLLGPLGTSALVLLLLICMLLQREDLRGRMIRLIGKGNISATTRGMDDAAKRVARYLLMQLIVNATYGIAIGVGLYFIGIPSAFVWGVLATVLRFIPYVGPWIAAAFPIALSLAVSKDWTMPLLTLGLFAVLELLSNNVMEPMLYGSSTGVSSIALIIAAVFWTWLWGAAGLVLATPLTVCLVVMGRHIPNMSMLSVLLSDEEALTPDQEFYHRLLTPAANDASEYADHYVKAHTRTELYDGVFIKALTAIELDHQTGELEDAQHQALHLEIRDIIDDLGTKPVIEPKSETSKVAVSASGNEKAEPTPPPAPPPPSPTCRVLCLPARAERDGLTSAMLAQLLQQNGFSSVSMPAQLTTGELIAAVDSDNAEAVVVSVIAPTTVIHARYLCGKLRARQPKLRIIVGMWGATEGVADATQRLRSSGADEVVTTLFEAQAQLAKYASLLAHEAVMLAPSADDEAERLAELDRLHLMGSATDPELDRITAKLARILNLPIALISFIDKEKQFFKSQNGLPEEMAKARGTSRDVSVCSQVVASNEPLIVNDLARDRRFANNPLLKEGNLRFYAGVPLRSRNGPALGSLCVLGHQPSEFGEHEKRLLEETAEEVMEIVNRKAGQAAVASSPPDPKGEKLEAPLPAAP